MCKRKICLAAIYNKHTLNRELTGPFKARRKWQLMVTNVEMLELHWQILAKGDKKLRQLGMLKCTCYIWLEGPLGDYVHKKDQVYCHLSRS